MGMKVFKINGQQIFFGIREWASKTPKLLSRLGNSLFVVSAFAATYTYFQEHPKWTPWIVGAGILGKLLTSLFGEPNPKLEDDNE